MADVLTQQNHYQCNWHSSWKPILLQILILETKTKTETEKSSKTQFHRKGKTTEILAKRRKKN